MAVDCNIVRHPNDNCMGKYILEDCNNYHLTIHTDDLMDILAVPHNLVVNCNIDCHPIGMEIL